MDGGPLYHFSEEPDIAVFHPRPSAAYPDLPPVVWAIAETHKAHYYFPRDCPRVICWKTKEMSKADEARLFGGTSAGKFAALESRWLERMRRTELYRYVFDPGSFEPFGDAPSSGYYVSRETVKPLAVEPVGDLIAALLDERLELRFTPNLGPIRDEVAASTAGFSIIRFRNAAL